MFRTLVWLGVFAAAMIPGASAQAQTLSLTEAIENTLALAPELYGADARIDAARAGRTQADTRPNPNVSFAVENFLGTGALQGFTATEVTATYGQLIERGGKREARNAFATRDITVSEIGRDIVALDLIQRVETAYYDALAAQAALTLAEEHLNVAQGLSADVQRRVDAARDPLFAATRAAANVAEAEVNLAAATRARDNAVAQLAALWGAPGEGLTLDADAFYRTGDSESAPAGALPVPEDRLADAQVARAAAATEVERSRAVVDPTVHGGVRYFGGVDAAALVAGVSVPLPLYNNNEGAIARAVAEREAAERDAEAARLARLRAVASLQRDLQSAEEKAFGLRDEVVPLANRATEEARDGFRRGGFTFRDVQDADAALLAARAAWIDALSETHRLRVALNRLTGRYAYLIRQENR